ncbi:MAG: flavodoxin, partial [Lachnospiraceae bacterium]|nr:flavodoxin [Lachnospiraceae bacterium]
MKKIVMALLMVAMVISLTACGQNAGQGGNTSSDTLDREQSSVPTGGSEAESVQLETTGALEPSGNANLTGTDGTEAADIQNVPDEEGSKVLVAYFSATGTTKGVAEIIAGNMGADIYEIVPKEPYTDADLDWHDDSSRSTIEMNDSSSRPEIDGAVEDMEQYDIVFIGYPIWWGEAPRIVSTFME